MNYSNKIFWITRTAIFIALLVVLQAATAPFGSSLITGSIVNLMLIISVMTCGFISGLSVALVSPIIAKFFGIGPLWSLIFFITTGNIVLVTLWYFIGNRNTKVKIVSYIVALATAAIAKFLTLYLGIVKIAIPFFLRLSQKQAAMISNMFSIPQLITATIGGTVAIIILPILKKAINKK